MYDVFDKHIPKATTKIKFYWNGYLREGEVSLHDGERVSDLFNDSKSTLLIKFSGSWVVFNKNRIDYITDDF